MVRVGQNPMKHHDKGILWQEVTFVTSVYIPSLTGYWKESLDVLKVCIESLQQDKSVPFDIMVVNNGSCDEVHRYLETMFAEKKIQFLIHSEFNLGKGGGWNLALPAAPGQYLAYSDCDVLFKPGWLKKSLELFKSFPNVGMVTARPNRSKNGIEAGNFVKTIETLKDLSNAEMTSGRLIAKQILDDHAKSIGYTDTSFFDFDCDDTLVTLNGASAYVGAYHFQFVTTKEAATKILPLDASSSLSSGPDHAWDRKMNELGYIKLTLTEPLCRHLGNTLQGENIDSLLSTDSISSINHRSAKSGSKQSFLVSFLKLFVKIPKIRGLYTRLYRTLFEVIS